MKYFKMNLKPGKTGKADPDIIRNFLNSNRIVGIGDDSETGGFGKFKSIKIGDIILLVTDGVDFVLEATSSWFDVSNSSRSIEVPFDWLVSAVEVSIISEGSKGFLGIVGNQKTCCEVSGREEIRAINAEIRRKLKTHKMNDLKKLIMSQRQIILTGAPGTGKTHTARELAVQIVGCKSEELQNHKRFGFIQFHPAYDYTDFVEGLKPKLESSQDNSISFGLRKGIFREFCDDAKNDQTNHYVFVIDEINRADLSRVFGELFFALDPGYRGESGSVATQYSSMYTREEDKRFYVPENVYVIGTMNDIDRSVESIDFALRRRFAWYEVKTDEELFRHVMSDLLTDNQGMKDEAETRYSALNNLIKAEQGLGESYCVGPAYFRKIVDYLDDGHDMWDSFWSYHLEPLLKEYLRGTANVDRSMQSFKYAYSLTFPTDE